MKINTIKQFNGLSRYDQWASGWAEKDNIDVFSYVSAACNPEDSLLFCRLLFPDFFVRDGAVFLNARYDPEIFDSWMNKYNGDVCAVEKMMNHTHLYDIFSGCSDDVDDVIFEQLAEVVALAWRLVLKDKFPESEFVVDVSNSDQDYGPIVTFYQLVVG